MKVGIIGTGVFSTSIAITLASNKDNEIIMWSENKKLVEDFKKTKKLNTIFKDRSIPKNIKVTNEYQEAIDEVELVFLVTGVEYLESVCKDLKKIIDPDIPVCIATKGLATTSKKLNYEIGQKILKNKVSIIAGPTFAIDVANLEPIGFTLASKDKKGKEIIKKAFDFKDLYIEDSVDLTGVAICGCVKNIYAIGSGIINGLGNHESTQAFYLKAVYEELSNVLYAYKSCLETLNSLAGFGDLILTCSSNKSRNYSYGELIGKKGNKKEAKKFLEKNTVEGVNTVNAMYHILKKKHVKCPIINTIYEILNNDLKPQKLIDVLISKND